jgi:hypothetical protein
MIFNKSMLIATAVAIVYSNVAMAQTAAAPTEPTYAIPNSKIAWKNQYPSGMSPAVPKPEWLALIKEDPSMKITPNILTVGK